MRSWCLSWWRRTCVRGFDWVGDFRFLEEESLTYDYDPVTKQQFEKKLKQSEAIVSQWHGTSFTVVNRASLPKRPEGLGRAAEGMIGLVAGLVSGMIAAGLIGVVRPAQGFGPLRSFEVATRAGALAEGRSRAYTIIEGLARVRS